VIDITWFGETDDRVNEDICLTGSSCADGEFTMGSVHRVTRLESDDASPVELCKMCAKFGGGN
jgi:hypothetical protein